MKGRYKQRNDRTIDRAIAGFMKSSEQSISEGYVQFMQGALEHLLDVHSASDHHVNEDETVAAAVIHNGIIVKIITNHGGEQVRWKKATERLPAVISFLPRTGWVGVLLSGMKGWYNVDKEMGHLTDTAAWSNENFTKYFKKIG